MRIVVTGASGNVGTALLTALEAEGGHELVGISRRRPPAAPPYDRVEWVCTDISEAGAADRLTTTFRGADAVVHLAWLLQPQRRPDVLRRTNVDGTTAVARAAVRAGVEHLVHQSSVGAYSPGAGRRVDETWPTGGIATSVYSRDKAAAERVVDGVEDDLVLTRVRPALIFQEAAASEIGRYFLGPLVPKALVRPGLLRWAPLPDSLAFQAVHADDVAAALALIVRTRAGGAYNVAAPPVIDRAAFRSVFGGVGPPAPPALLRAAAAASWHARLQPTEPGWIDLARHVPIMRTERLAALGWSAERDAGTVLRRFVAALGAGSGGRGPLLHPRRPRPDGG